MTSGTLLAAASNLPLTDDAVWPGAFALVGIPILVLLVVLFASREHGRELRREDAERRREQRRRARELDDDLAVTLDLRRHR